MNPSVEFQASSREIERPEPYGNGWLTLLFAELALIFFLIPAGRFETEIFNIHISSGYDAYKLFPYVFLTWWLWRRTQEGRCPPRSFLLPPLYAFFLISLLSALGSPDFYEAIPETLEIGFYIGFFLLLLDLPWNGKRFSWVTGSFLLGNFYLGLIAYLQYRSSWRSGELPRISATFDYPNALGAYALLAFTLLAWCAVRSRAVLHRLVIALAAGCVLFAMILSLSRAAYISLGIWVLVMSWYATRGVVRWGLLLAALLVLLSVWWLVPQLGDRFSFLLSEVQRQEEASRIFIYPAVLRQELPNFFFLGVGLGPNIPDRMVNQITSAPSEYALADAWHPHNLYLDLLLATGWLGLLAFLWLLVLAIHSLARHSSLEGKILLAGLLAFMVHQFFEIHLLLGNIPILLISLLALTTVIQHDDPAF